MKRLLTLLVIGGMISFFSCSPGTEKADEETQEEAVVVEETVIEEEVTTPDSLTVEVGEEEEKVENE
ncbi:MAG: hypothetical protein K8R58_09145 [Bacteroidales bacterium]|nr:hypothetical protein [Bacteroidales bacterium]